MRGAGELLNQWYRAGSGVNAGEGIRQFAQDVAQSESAVDADAGDGDAVRIGEDLCLATTASNHADLANDPFIRRVQPERHVVRCAVACPVQAVPDVVWVFGAFRQPLDLALGLGYVQGEDAASVEYEDILP